MKILIVADNYYPNVNGSSYFTQRLAYYLQQRGHEILVMASSPSIKNEPFVYNGVNVFGIRSFSPPLYPGFRFPAPIGIRKAIEIEIKKFQPDVIHIQDHFVISPVVQKVAKELSIPMIGTNHFMPENLLHYLHLPKRLEQIAKNWAWRQFRAIFEQLHTVTTPTRTAAKLLEEVKLTKPVLAVSNGIDLQKFKPGNDGEYLRKRLNLPDQPILLYVGRLDKEKNIDAVMKVLPGVLARTDLHFVIAGKGAEQEKLKRLARQLNLEKSVTFAGFVPDEDLPNLYTIGDCFVIAGIAELQSLVTMEAMATGLPVVAVNAMALPELVRHGENGYLFDLGRTDILSEHLLEIFSNPDLRKKMGDRSLEIIQAHDINKTMEIFESLYENLIGRDNITMPAPRIREYEIIN
ncbi:MAG: glycosyltransferase [Candidatus Doudnabacteria bacterium]